MSRWLFLIFGTIAFMVGIHLLIQGYQRDSETIKYIGSVLLGAFAGLAIWRDR